jgi:phenylalanyl-tRNA synthetase alpha chain
MEDNLFRLKNNIIATLSQISSLDELESYYFKTLGKKGDFSLLLTSIRTVPPEDRQRIGIAMNEAKKTLESAFSDARNRLGSTKSQKEEFDATIPGIKPEEGHLHIATHAINEITEIFERIGFMRSIHPEVDWDWYAFEGLNFPKNHPARDEWETFFIDGGTPKKNEKFKQMVLTPHTSNSQVREMEKGILPIRMINIAKCYRRQSDISHVEMFHQFEGLYIDKHVSIAHLKGVIDFFFKQFFGPKREARLRPYHFQFTEPSFEIDVSCGLCFGSGKLADGQKCRMCKEGWLELGGAGMVHPNVLKNGGVDPSLYNGFAFGWGVERSYMMKSGTNIDDIRSLYTNDIRFLEQW